MSEHVKQWIDAYLDGELQGVRREHVEAHLAGCASCRQELQAARRLSGYLRSSPLSEDLPFAEDFAAGLVNRLPERSRAAPRGTTPGLVWWLIPLGILGAWISAQLIFLLKEWSWALGPLSFVNGALAWLAPNLLGNAWLDLAAAPFRQALGQAGTAWAVEFTAFWQGDLLRFALNAAVALLFLSWLAGLWARRAHLSVQPVQSSETPTIRKEG